jgi:acyl-CoA synthetase (NDP forming)
LAWAVDIVKEVVERMRPLFYPKSVAIVGASDNPTRFGYTRLKCLLDFGYKGAVYPVNPRLAGKEVLGLKCYGSVLDIPDEVDLAYMDVSARTALSVLRDCGKKGVKAAIIFAGGFSEVGDEGRKLEDEIQAIAKETGMVILGPNCIGVTNLYANLCTFALNLGNLNLDARSLEPGKISLIAQSGTLSISFLLLSLVRGFHPGKIVSSGNEVVVTLTEVLEYFVEDPDTKVIAMYIEAVRNGRKFIELCRSTTKPLVALKAGKFEAGKSAARSHTAAIAGSAEVWNAVCKQAGIIQAESFEELYELSMALASPLRPHGNRVAIVSVLGGPAVIASDACERQGLRVPKLTEESVKRLRQILPPIASVTNPVDTTGSVMEDINMFRDALEVVCQDPNIDMIITMPPIMHAPSLINISRAVVDATRQYGKPIVVVWALPFGVKMREFEEAIRILSKGEVPHCYMPERATKMLSALLTQTELEKKKAKARGF